MHKAWRHIQEVEALGGMTKAIETGLPKMRIEEAAARRQARIDPAREVIVGVNKYRREHDDADRGARSGQRRRSRDADCGDWRRSAADAMTRRWSAALRALTQAAERGDGNLLALAVDAARGAGDAGRDFRRAGEGVRAVPGRQSYHLRRVLLGERAGSGVPEGAADGRAVCRGRGAASAHPRGQAGTGRARPRRQGHRHGVCRPRLRRRRRAAVPDAAAKRRAWRWRTTCTCSASRPWRVATRRSSPSVIAALRQLGRADILVVVGGVIPPQDHAFLRRRA